MKLIKVIFILILIYPLNVFASTKAVVDITNMSITDLANALNKGYLTSELLVTLYLERIDAYNEEFNAIREINENAINEAKNLDKEREEGNIRSILHGIPIIVKTNIDVKGLATTAGASALSNNEPIEDAEVIKKLKDAGAIILASANMSEFAFAASNSNSSYGKVKNAFNPNYTPYGSSGGSAVSIALSFAAASLGTDTNSSVRLPAAAAGLVGLRPSLNLVSTNGVIPYDVLRDTVGIITKTVEDNSIILSIINENKINYEPNLKNLEGLKIGVIKSYLKGENSNIKVNSFTDKDIYNLTNSKIKLLEEAGAKIIYIDELIDEYYYHIAINTMSGDSFCDGFNQYIKKTTGTIRSFKDLANSPKKIYNLTGYLSGCNENWTYDLEKVLEKKDIFEQHIKDIFKSYDLDLIVYPTTKNKVFQINSSESAIAPGSFLGSVIGYPSLTVPMGYINEFSYGLEFFSLKNNENLLYSVANVFEDLNNLALTNSSLAPSLYEIPNYIKELMKYYETYENELTHKTRTYFLNYSSNTEEENRQNAEILIKEYQEFLNQRNINNIMKIIIIMLLIIILMCTILLISIYILIMKKIKVVYKKIKNKDSKSIKTLLKYR